MSSTYAFSTLTTFADPRMPTMPRLSEAVRGEVGRLPPWDSWSKHAQLLIEAYSGGPEPQWIEVES